LVLILLAALFLWRSKVKAERAQAIRDASYGRVLSHFQRDLSLDMHRSEVYDYLRSHSVKFYDGGGSPFDAEVPIGQEPADLNHFPCYAFDVLIVFHFNVLPHQPMQSPLDNLSHISIEKWCEK